MKEENKKIISKISPGEALEILRILAGKNPNVAKQIEETAEKLLKEVEPEEVCNDVYWFLDLIDVGELWDRSGSSRYGYTSPEEMALKMLEKELEPFGKKVIRYFELGMPEEAKLYCMGVLKGIYKYVQESESEFKDWAEDLPEECFKDLLKEWKKRAKNEEDFNEMNKFLEKECNKWAEWALKI